MRILVTGSAGMVGRNVKEAPGAAAHEVLAPVRRELDLSNRAQVLDYVRDKKPDMIIHAAGRVGGITANMSAQVEFLIENFDLGRNIIAAAMQVGVPRLLNLGSSCMYPRAAENPLRESQILTGEFEPTNEGYAIAKVAALRLCMYINRERQGLSYKTFIPCNLYGPYDKFDVAVAHMLPAVIARLDEAARRGDAVAQIWGDGTARREFLYAGDLANAIWRAVETFDSVPEVMNVGPGYDCTINEFYAAIAETVGFTGRFVHDLSKPVGMQRKLMEVSRMTEWGFAPSHSLAEGLALTYRYYREQVVAAAA
jgi:GDP-L-fucose synthase